MIIKEYTLQLILIIIGMAFFYCGCTKLKAGNPCVCYGSTVEISNRLNK